MQPEKFSGYEVAGPPLREELDHTNFHCYVHTWNESSVLART
jgi:hypothetical protein